MEPTSHNAHAAQPTRTESEVLDEQMEQAKKAVLRTLDDVKANLGTAADVRLWTQRYPWIAVGVAAATGFAAASLVTPSRGEKLQDKLDELAAKRKEDFTPANEPGAAAESAAAATSTRIATTIFGSLLEIARIAVTNFAKNVMRPPMSPTATENGHGQVFTDAPEAAASTADDIGMA